MPYIVSSNWTAVCMGIGIFVITQLLRLGFRGWEAMKRQWMENVAIGVAAVVVCWFGLYAWSIVATVYHDHRNLAERLRAVVNEKDALKRGLDDRDQYIKRLEHNLTQANVKPRSKVPVSSRQDWLTATQTGNIESVLKGRLKERAQIRLVCVGKPIPKYADQIQETFKAANWPMDRLEIASAGMTDNFPEPLYILAPKADDPTVTAIVRALEAGRLSAPVHIGIPSMGPLSLGIPAASIVIKASD